MRRVSLLIAAVVGFLLAFVLKGTQLKPSRAGGVAVLVGMVAGVAMGAGWPAFFTLRVFWLSLSILFLMGTVDDRLTLRPGIKFAFQTLAAAIFLVLTPAGTWGGGIEEWAGPWAYAIWLFWIVAITNALNLLDNMDGLTPGIAIIAAFGCLASGMGADWVLWPLAGALIGFLGLNFYRAPIYLGDAGSHLVGFSLAVLPFYGLDRSQAWLPILLLAVPILDTAFVTVTRLMRGASPFVGGKDHLSHRLFRMGWPTPAVAGLFYLIAGGLALLVWLLRD